MPSKIGMTGHVSEDQEDANAVETLREALATTFQSRLYKSPFQIFPNAIWCDSLDDRCCPPKEFCRPPEDGRTSRLSPDYAT